MVNINNVGQFQKHIELKRIKVLKTERDKKLR